MGEANTDQGTRGGLVDPQRVDHWRWRRRIALASLISGLLYPLLASAAAIIEPLGSTPVRTITRFWPGTTVTYWPLLPAVV